MAMLRPCGSAQKEAGQGLAPLEMAKNLCDLPWLLGRGDRLPHAEHSGRVRFELQSPALFR